MSKKKPRGKKKQRGGRKRKQSTGASTGSAGTPPTPPAAQVSAGTSPDHDRARAALDQALTQHTNLTPSQQQDYRTAALAIIDQMTATAVQHFNRNLAGYRFFPDQVSLNQYFRPNDPRVAAIVALGLGRLGAYNETNQLLELDGPSRLGPVTFDVLYIFAHEFGHAVDGPRHTFSALQDWQDAWQAEIVPAFATTNAATNPQEGFSKFANLVYGGQVARLDLDVNFPLCVAFWRKHGLW